MQIFYDIRNKARKLKAGVDYNMKDLESVFGLDFEDDLKYTEVREGLSISKWFEKVSDDLKYNRDWIKKIKFDNFVMFIASIVSLDVKIVKEEELYID